MLLIFTPTNGKLSLSFAQSEMLKGLLAKHEGEEMCLKVDTYKYPRTINQHKYLFGVVYKAISEYTGHTVNDVHEACKKMFLPPTFIRMGEREEPITGSTQELSIQDFARYLERVIAFAATELSISVPPPANE